MNLQAQDTLAFATMEGEVRDGERNYLLRAATVALYKRNDTALLNYQLSNHLGQFRFEQVPTGIPLLIIVSFTGYESDLRDFIIPTDMAHLKISTIKLIRPNNVLPEVIIKAVPPVRMNGDTLEFNANAFKLDQHAQTEDLIRKLPGITVWNDGVITFNGKKINSVLVNGKPFFGEDARIATQNLPKNIVDKVQIYQKIQDPRTPIDSIMEMNIKLKKGKEKGFFGKINSGVGTRSRYEMDASLNYYTPRTQIGAVGSLNNVNKSAEDVSTLMRYNTYKSLSANTEYQSDFSKNGQQKFQSLGLMFQHDFIPQADYENNNRLKADYLHSITNTTVDQAIQTETKLLNDTTLLQYNKDQENTTYISDFVSAEYEKIKNKKEVKVSAIYQDYVSENELRRETNSYINNDILQSYKSALNTSKEHSTQIKLQTEAKLQGKNPQNNYQLQYNTSLTDLKKERFSKIIFISPVDSTQNRYVNREYKYSKNNAEHFLNVKIGDLKNILFRTIKPGNVKFEFQNTMDMLYQRNANYVTDKDSLNVKTINPSLSYNSRLNQFVLTPSLIISKSYVWGLYNRYLKSFDVQVVPKAQFFSLRNNSNLDFQNLYKHFNRFVPELVFKYSHKIFGRYEKKFSLKISQTAKYPDIEQLVPVVDSSAQYYILTGNAQLLPEDRTELNFTYTYAVSKTQNTFACELQLKTGFTNNYISDSTYFDAAGRSFHYLLNINGYKDLQLTGNLTKVLKMNDHQVQLEINSGGGLYKTPGFINNQFLISQTLLGRGELEIGYTYKDYFAASLITAFTQYRINQIGLYNNEFKSRHYKNNLAINVLLTKRISFVSNISYNKNLSEGLSSVNFVIWNVMLTTRIFKNQNGEIKFSAFDLLRQNKGFIHSNAINSLSFGRTNALQQYFMLTVSYYPRKFGKK
ncbi:MAG: hypothetical protein QM768_13420 [Agriterribacter sp.]